MRQDKIAVAYASDDGYTNQTIVSMVSVLLNSPDKAVELILLYSHLSQANLEKFERLRRRYDCALRLIRVDEREFEGLPLSPWVPVEAWFRVKLPELCLDFDRVLYLDGDTLSVGDLSELWRTDMSGKYMAAVRDVWGVRTHLRRLGLSGGLYFNSGVLLINSVYWRERDMMRKIRDYCRANSGKIVYCDQDTLNKITDAGTVELPQKFNYMDTWWRNGYCEYQGEDALRYAQAKVSPVIIHFTGPKPCRKGCLHPMADVWWRYARETDIFDELKSEYEQSVAPADKKRSWLKRLFSVENEFSKEGKRKVVILFGRRIFCGRYIIH